MTYLAYRWYGSLYLVDDFTLKRRVVTPGELARLSLIGNNTVWGLEQVSQVGKDATPFVLFDSRFDQNLKFGIVRCIGGFRYPAILVNILGDTLRVEVDDQEVLLNGRVMFNTVWSDSLCLQLLHCYSDDAWGYILQYRLTDGISSVLFKVKYAAKKVWKYYVAGRWYSLA